MSGWYIFHPLLMTNTFKANENHKPQQVLLVDRVLYLLHRLCKECLKHMYGIPFLLFSEAMATYCQQSSWVLGKISTRLLSLPAKGISFQLKLLAVLALKLWISTMALLHPHHVYPRLWVTFLFALSVTLLFPHIPLLGLSPNKGKHYREDGLSNQIGFSTCQQVKTAQLRI